MRESSFTISFFISWTIVDQVEVEVEDDRHHKNNIDIMLGSLVKMNGIENQSYHSNASVADLVLVRDLVHSFDFDPFHYNLL